MRLEAVDQMPAEFLLEYIRQEEDRCLHFDAGETFRGRQLWR